MHRLVAVLFALALALALALFTACGPTAPPPSVPCPPDPSPADVGTDVPCPPLDQRAAAGAPCSRDCDCHGNACSTQGICAAPVKAPAETQ
ncbi:MAG: hypothetical protein ABI134_35575 [Byssovorax sp.]